MLASGKIGKIEKIAYRMADILIDIAHTMYNQRTSIRFITYLIKRLNERIEEFKVKEIK
jgi:hypothetical protein